MIVATCAVGTARSQDERHFEVIAGKVIDANGNQHSFAFARNGQAASTEAFAQALAALSACYRAGGWHAPKSPAGVYWRNGGAIDTPTLIPVSQRNSLSDQYVKPWGLNGPTPKPRRENGVRRENPPFVPIREPQALPQNRAEPCLFGLSTTAEKVWKDGDWSSDSNGEQTFSDRCCPFI